MKDLIGSIKDNIITRLKNPFIGAFTFAWVSLNIEGVSIFFLVDTPSKISIIKNKDWMLSEDIIWPIFGAICYLFVLPVIHLFYDRFNNGWVIPCRLRISREKTISQIRAEPQFIRKYEIKNLDMLIAYRDHLLIISDDLDAIIKDNIAVPVMKDDIALKLEKIHHQILDISRALEDSKTISY